MGYPYYIRNCGGRIVLSSDLGILVFSVII